MLIKTIIAPMHLCQVASVVSDSAPLWTVARQVSLSIGFSRQEHWSGLPSPPAGDLPHPGMEPKSPALQVDTGKAPQSPPQKTVDKQYL